MQADWLLISVYGGVDTAAIVAVGDRPKPFVPLDHHFTSRRGGLNKRAVRDIEDAIEYLNDSFDRSYSSKGEERRTVAFAIRHDDGKLHAVYVWRGPSSQEPQQRLLAGAWEFNLTRGSAHGSQDLFELYGVSEEDRRSGVSQAGAFERLRTNADEGTALAKMVTAAPGTQHQAVWTFMRDDGEERAAHFSCRMIKDPSTGDIILRGVTQDLGTARGVETAPPPTILEHRVLDAIARPGEYRAIVDLKRLRLIRWHGTAMPNISWLSLEGQPTPAIHPDDIRIAQAMSKQLAAISPVVGVLRLRALDGTWMPVHLEVSLMALDQTMTAGLALVRPLQTREV